jgi:RNA polymerase sigma factor (sigma-70 family)
MVDRLVEEHLPYFERVIGRVCRELPAHLADELRSEGMVAIAAAAKQWDPAVGTSFRAYVSRTLAHRLVDEARKLTRYDREARRAQEPLSLDRPATDDEEASHGDQLVAAGGDPHERAELLERMEGLTRIPPRWRTALVLDLPDAMDALGVSESRVVQIRRNARALLAGEAPTPPPGDRAWAEPGADSPLSERETGVLRLIAAGDSNEEIAGKLHLSPETVKSHVKATLRKLNARNRAHAVGIAWQEGWWQAAA